MTIDPDLFAATLAEVVGAQPCCAGDRYGYQQHTKRGEEACPASKAAEAAYRRAYRGRPDAVRKPPVCGEYGGYLSHKKRGEDACEPCKEAKRAYDRDRYAKNPRRARAPQREYEARKRVAVAQQAVAA